MRKIKRILAFMLVLSIAFTNLACGGAKALSKGSGAANGETVSFKSLEKESSMEVTYAKNFSVDYYKGGFTLITIDSNDHRFLMVPEGVATPTDLDKDIVAIQKPLDNIYLVAVAAMTFFDTLDAVDTVKFSGAKEDGWYVDSAKKAMQEGKIKYAGKYSEPDYETLISQKARLSIQSGMIMHSPDVQEKLEELGIPVLIDRSSYETHPLGRSEWIKLYGVLLGKDKEAEEFFAKQAKVMDELKDIKPLNKKVAYFYINSNGAVVTRKTSDYIPKMIQIAGGTYAFEQLGDDDTATSSVTMELEEFYKTAKDADYIIYNSTIAGELETIDQLVAKNQLLKNIKAVKDGNVWASDKNVYQSTGQFGDIIGEMHKLLTDDTSGEFKHFYKLK